MTGLCTGAFILFDRLTKWHPVFYFVAAAEEGSFNRSLRLKVANRSERPILLYLPKANRDTEFGLGQDSSTMSVIGSLVAKETIVVVDGNTSTDIFVFGPTNAEMLPPDQKIVARLQWKFANPWLITARRSKKVGLTAEDARWLQAGAARTFDDSRDTDA